MKNSIYFFLILILAVSSVSAQNLFPSTVRNARDYSFIVAGHSYGCRPEAGECELSLGLYPKFIKNIEQNKENINFLILTGDISRTSSEESWQQIKNELQGIGLPYYLVLGNHDYQTIQWQDVFIEKYGNTYYQFDVGFERFIILDSQKDNPNISLDQLQFLEKSLNESKGIKTVFIFFHELLWNSDKKYQNVWPNKGSFYHNVKDSNFWAEVYPLLQEHSSQKIYLIAGDVGANPYSIPAYYEKRGNIVFIASGMGSVQEENYLLVTVNNGEIGFKLIHLNDEVKKLDLEEYTIEKVSGHSFLDWIWFWYVRGKEYFVNLF